MNSFLYEILITDGPFKGRRYPVPPEGFTLGRSSKCDVSFDDPALSRSQCRFELRDSDLWVIDLASANQTLVNDKPVDEVKLSAVDRVTVGQTVLTIENTGAPVKLSGKPAETTSPGYQTKEIEVVIEGRTPIKQNVSLMSDSGTISVTSDPAGAEVLVNGISRGHAPCRIDRIPGGTVTLAIKADGFETQTREIALAAGEVQSLDIKLKPLPGTLRVVSIPDKGRVYVNNEYKGTTPLDLVDIVPGDYRVRVDLPGHEPIARDVRLPQGASITEEFRLERNTGRLEVVTAPSGATILLDGKKVGITITRGMDSNAVSDPFAVEDIAEGEHEIEIFRKGFANQKRQINLKRGETLTSQFRLQRKFIPNYEVTTTSSYYKGVLEFLNEEGIRLETAPGISQTIPMKDVKKHGPLQEDE